MLVLTRKLGEEIMIGDNIRITILEINGNRTKIGIVAPRDVKVDRQEVSDKKVAAKNAAT